jgi:RNA polymerase sigma factor (sigma-70 family)
MQDVICHLHRIARRQDEDGLSDGQLLARFIEHCDEAAVTALVRRHGSMVWGACRRVLRNQHDAEDAFQATFLVLIRKARSIRQRDSVGNWLYGVAQQTALNARGSAARLRAREREMATMPDSQAAERETRRELEAVLDLELSRLPDRYRAAIVLCELEGKTRKDAARLLGLPEGTVAGHLTRGRAILARRLARRGVTTGGAALAAALAEAAFGAPAPAFVMASTIKVAIRVAAGQAMVAASSTRVAALTEGVLKAMLVTKLRTALPVCLMLGLVLFGGMFAYSTSAADQDPAPASAGVDDRLADTLILLDKLWWEAASKHDVETLSKLLADDWVCGGWKKAASLAHYRQARYVEVKHLTERRVVRIDKHTAMMSYEVTWRAETKAKGQPAESAGHDRIIHCWVQRGGGWFMKYTECVNLPMANPPVAKEATMPALPAGPTPLAPLPPPGLASVPFIDPLFAPATPWKAGVRASSTDGTNTPEKAFDGKRDTMWNSFGYAPAWIEKDLGATTPVTGIALCPSQTPDGETIHEVWVSDEPIGNDRTKARLVHTFKGLTKNVEDIRHDFPKDISARYVQIRTTESPSWIGWFEVDVLVKAKAQ